jgi:hypothetical protein
MGLLAALLPTVLSLFAPRAQAQLQKITGAPPDVAEAFTKDLFGKIGQATGVGEINTEAQAVQAVAALQQAAKTNPAVVQQVEAHALDYLDKLLPVIDKLAEQDKARWQADRESSDAAAARGRADRYDIGPRLVKAGDWIFGISISGRSALMGVQMLIEKNATPDPTLASILVVLIYAAARGYETPRRYRFGGPSESAASEVATAAASKALKP